MHRSAMIRMEWFVSHYIPRDTKVKVLDIGSYNVNGCYRDLFKDNVRVEYVGLDMAEGPNVDYVPQNPYVWQELEDESFDYVISGNAFEHIEYPWLTMCEIYKKLKNGGFACILAPCTIDEHRYPTDCYRYYSDGFRALAKWAGFQIISVSVSGVPDENIDESWYNEGHNDTVMILGKGILEDRIGGLPKLEKEVRYYNFFEWGRKYNFLRHLITDENPSDTMKEFFENKNYKRVYLYAYGDVGKIVFSYLKNIKGIDLYIMDAKGGFADEREILLPGTKIIQDKDSCLFIAFLKASLKSELNDIYPGIDKYYADDIYEGID